MNESIYDLSDRQTDRQTDRRGKIGFLQTVRVIAFLGVFICTLISSIQFSVKTVYAESAQDVVAITNEQPVVGEQLNVSVANPSEEDVSYSYIWTIDNQEINSQDSYYVPIVADYEHWIEVKVYNGATLVGSDKIYFSKLPVVYIYTEDGEAVTSRTEYKAGDMLVQGNAEFEQEYKGSIQIRSRGNQSWYFPKKPYKIKLDVSTDLFGFGKNKHWVLLANYRDESLLRNTVANEISTSMGIVGADTTWVDVVINDEYVGNYQFCEQVRVDESRINIFDWDDEVENVAKAIYNVERENGLTKEDRNVIEDLLSKDYSWIDTGTITYNDVIYNILEYYDYNKDISGGYLLELNGYNASLDGERDISEFGTDAGMRVVVDTPEYAVTNDTMMKYIKEYMQDYEDAYISVDGYNSEGVHYTQMTDFNSMLCYWLTQEICGNNDAVGRSRWAYKDIGGLLAFGPVWDFDYGFGIASIGSDATGWKFTTSIYTQNFFKNWIDDPYFTVKAQEQYWSIRPYLQSIVDENGMIDQYNAYLKESGAANERVWKWQRGYQGDTDAVKIYLRERLAWLDKQFTSQESIIKSLHTPNSANPYTKSDSRLAIILDNVAADTISANAPADGVISTTDNLECTIEVNDEDTKALAVYVNGLKLNESGYIFDVIDGQCSFEVPANILTQKTGSKNVISLIGKDINGAVTYTNFASVIVDDDVKDIVAYDYLSGTPNVAVETDLENCSYPATSGALAAGSTLSASVNGTDELELIYSKDEYTDELGVKVHVPVMAASATNLWGENAYYEIKCSTKEYENVSFSASLGATKKGPRNFKLQYSLDKENYIDIEGSGKSLTDNKEMQKLYSSFELPKECANRETLYIRVVIASDVMVNGSGGLIGAAGGEVAINHICVQSIEPKYIIRFKSNGGSVVKAIRGKDGMLVEEPENPVREGYIFTGWYSDEALTEEYEFTTMPSQDITLYAGWEVNSYTITFESKGGSEVAFLTVDYGAKVKEPEEPSKIGYTFTGWYSDEALTEEYGFTTMPSQDITLYASWKVNSYTITFESNGGSEVDFLKADYGAKVEKPEEPSKIGYTFTGWYSDEALTEEYEFTTMPSQDITLYAGWEVNSYMITFESKGGSEVTFLTVDYGAKIEKPENPVREGYTFTDWYEDEEMTKVYAFEKMPPKDIVLYAGWAKNVYKVVYVDNDGTVVNVQEISHGDSSIAPDGPSHNGYTFLGWTTTADYVTGNMIIIATYKKVEDQSGTDIVQSNPQSGTDIVQSDFQGDVNLTTDGTVLKDANTVNQVDKVTISLNATYKKAFANKKAKVVITKKVKSITLYTKKLKTAQLSPVVTGTKGSVKWYSSNLKVVKVSKQGKVTAVGKGIAYVTAEVGGVCNRCKIVVKKTQITFAQKTTSVMMQLGKKQSVGATIVPQGIVTYKTSDKNIVSVSRKGIMKAQNVGTAIITVKANGIKKKLKVIVQEVK